MNPGLKLLFWLSPYVHVASHLFNAHLVGYLQSFSLGGEMAEQSLSPAWLAVGVEDRDEQARGRAVS